MSSKSINLIPTVVSKIEQIKGVVKVVLLSEEERKVVAKLECASELNGAVGGTMKFVNEGTREALKREAVMVVIGDDAQGLRAPAKPWVMLMDDKNEIIGEWLCPDKIKEFKCREDVIFISNDFIIYKNKAFCKDKKDEYWLLPAIPFPEIENIEGICDVVLGSPSIPADYFLKKKLNMLTPKLYRLWSLLVGFNYK